VLRLLTAPSPLADWQVLGKDLRTVQSVVEDTVRDLGGGSGSASVLSDAVGALESIADSHRGQLLPRVRECDESIRGFMGR
jgi:hypothetical protein